MRYSGTMTTDTRIPTPTIAATMAAILEVVRESPQATTRLAYLDADKLPYDLVAHVLDRLDAPIRTAARGTYEFNGPKWYNQARLPTLWNRLFTGTMLDPTAPWESNALVPSTPDYPHVLFHRMTLDRNVAEDFLVYCLLGKIQHFNDKGYDWKNSARRGLMSMRNWMNHAYSGFLVQTRGAHEDLRAETESTITKAIKELS